PTALVEGYAGVRIAGAAGTVTNFGTIRGVGASAYENALDLAAGGVVTNGAATDHAALIEGYAGVQILGAAGTVTNFGTIRSLGASGFEKALYLKAGGLVTNGGVDDTAALIQGASGVLLSAAGTILNFGAIRGTTGSGVELGSGGRLTNGGGGDRSALIEGSNGVFVQGAAATVHNFGTVRATGAFGNGVALLAGGVVVNGALNNRGALIEGFIGLSLSGGAAAATNFGTIRGVGALGGYGAFLGGGADLTNGAPGHAKATIEGFEGVEVTGSGGTLTNFGTIIGAGGAAVQFNASTDLLVVEAGCAFVGAVIGGGGTLKLDTGVGRLSGLFGAEGDVTVSGSMAATTFDDFATIRIGQAAAFTASGTVSLTAGEAILNSGSLTLGGKASVTSAGLIEADRGTLAIAGAVKNTGTLAAAGGTLAVAGAVTGSGSATVAGGVLDFEAAFTEDVTFTGKTGILELAKSQTYTGTVTGFSKSGGTSLDLGDIAFSKATTATYSGTKSGGVLTVTDGAHTARIHLMGDYRSSTFVVASDGHGGTLVHDPAAPAPVSASAGRFAAAMAGWAGGGAGPVEARALWAHAPPLLLAPRTQIA
ncbi:MAG: hypothetical protein H0X27_09330, partial [Caulobacteraceae bacterium]|nr:hypothetical protein [Caulobacteraceae bacterium]